MPRGDRSVDVNVKRLRAKLARLNEAPIAITTQPGVGYRLELAPEQTTVTAL
ncbi:MAG: helix-turn-helix domain-containing protein [Actinomycetota bacterium]|nr:helix-turn-helix domain-containing protein [Actinomycetota bacterium]